MIALSAQTRIVELRRYVMRPGRRDDLIAIFEREFIEGQEACGMLPIGHYRDVDDDDAFVWFRGFESMETRRAALEAFYLNSDVWRINRDAANETMIDSDNVLLLQPARADRAFDLQGLSRPRSGDRSAHSFSGLAVLMLQRPAQDAMIAVFEEKVLHRLDDLSTRVACYLTAPFENDFPRLPVREDEYAIVVSGVLSNLDDFANWTEVLQPSNLPRELASHVIATEYLRLHPAARSLLR
ncbi:MAG TPA: NIPSNAP family protein [Candidatus Baltobacteraceae bacterium]|jgi:hypothetical protein|nr:NIPSNAP family protein [Candidatus Baltobacteraceae bacterium]